MISQSSAPIVADILKPHIQKSSKNLQDHQDFEDLCKVSQLLKTKVLPKLVCELDDLRTVCVSSNHLTHLFHSEGINMRYLGLALRHCTQYHVKVLFVTEILARTAKNIFNETLSQHILDLEDQTTLIENYSLICVVDFLNLLFGNSEESNLFRHDVLFPRAQSHFKVNKEDLKIDSNVALFYAFSERTGISRI